MWGDVRDQWSREQWDQYNHLNGVAGIEEWGYEECPCRLCGNWLDEDTSDLGGR